MTRWFLTLTGLLVLFGAPAISGDGLASAPTPLPATPVAPKAAASPSREPGGMSLEVSPRIVHVPGRVLAQVRVDRHADNRLLQIEVDSDGYYRSSDVELEGIAAPRTHFIWLNALPSGAYTVTVRVQGTDGVRAEAVHTFEVF